jgi:formate hydrogenlyase subunit 6/NADH:ubiquinone oxidoreductase subunit I
VSAQAAPPAPKLTLAWETCVKLRSRAASCRACVDACPTKAIAFDGPRESVAVDLSKCIECGLCQAACPTESFSGAVDVPAFLATAPADVKCTNAPAPPGEMAGERGRPPLCLAALSAEDLVVLALKHGTLRVDVQGCAQCRTAPLGQQALTSRVEQARELLVALGAKARITVALEKPGAAPVPAPLPSGEKGPNSRRAFLRRLVPPAIAERVAPPPPRLELDVTKLRPAILRSQEPPPRRLRLLAALDAAKLPAPKARLPEELVGFASSKALDVNTCTACALCVTTCPTGALSTSTVRDELRFDASRCVKCHTCHDVCEPRAITKAKTFDLGHFVSREVRALGRLTIKSCAECGAPFKHGGGEDFLCERCRDLDEEARELVGLE